MDSFFTYTILLTANEYRHTVTNRYLNYYGAVNVYADNLNVTRFHVYSVTFVGYNRITFY